MNRPIDIVIVGSGNVAEALATAIAGSEALRLRQIYARNLLAGSKLAEKCGCEFVSEGVPAKADLYLLAVSDGAIAQLSAGLDFQGGVVAHTAGSVDVRALSSRIAHRAVLYPLQTFSRGRRISLRRVPMLVEGITPQALECVEQVARALSTHVERVASAQREWIHLAAVFVSNFANQMYAIGEELASEEGFSFDLFKPLLLETARKAATAPSPRDVQTGPAVRGDFRTKSRHVELLQEHPELRNLYTAISNYISRRK